MNLDEVINNLTYELEIFRKENKNGIPIIWGTTASGKSALSIHLAKYFQNIEIISADSRQIFKYLDIGTDKVSKEIRNEITHHQIDIINPDEFYTAGNRKKDTEKIIEEIFKRGNYPIIVGGTGLYINTIYKNLDMPEVTPDFKLREELYNEENSKPGILHERLQKIDPEEGKKIHPKSTRYIIRALEIYYKTGYSKSQLAGENEVKYPLFMIGLRREKENVNKKINKRVEEMIENGIIEETNKLLKMGYKNSIQSLNGIGYKESYSYLKGEINKDKLIELMKRNTHKFAKRQRTWFKGYILDKKVRPRKNVKYKIYNIGD